MNISHSNVHSRQNPRALLAAVGALMHNFLGLGTIKTSIQTRAGAKNVMAVMRAKCRPPHQYRAWRWHQLAAGEETQLADAECDRQKVGLNLQRFFKDSSKILQRSAIVPLRPRAKSHGFVNRRVCRVKTSFLRRFTPSDKRSWL